LPRSKEGEGHGASESQPAPWFRRPAPANASQAGGGGGKKKKRWVVETGGEDRKRRWRCGVNRQLYGQHPLPLPTSSDSISSRRCRGDAKSRVRE